MELSIFSSITGQKLLQNLTHQNYSPQVLSFKVISTHHHPIIIVQSTKSIEIWSVKSSNSMIIVELYQMLSNSGRICGPACIGTNQIVTLLKDDAIAQQRLHVYDF